MSTLTELRDRVLDGSRRAGLTDTTEITSLINQAYLQLVAQTRPLITTATITLVSGTGDYTLSAAPFSLTDIQDIRNLVITDSGTLQSYLLQQCTPEFMALIRQTQSTAGGQMTYWSASGLNQISFFPAPSSTSTSLALTYQARPALLAAAGDVPVGIPVEYHDLIVVGALARAVRVWKPEIGSFYHDSYNKMLGEYRQYLNRRTGAWKSKAVVRGTKTNNALHGNDIYYTGMDN